MNSIFHRVSIRKFQDKPVEPEKIETLLRAAMAAPSARNQQPWEFYVVTNKDLIQKLSTVSPYAGCAKDAPVLIVSAYREDAISPAYAQIDLSIANENIWLEADALSLGGVWLGIAPVEERMKAVKEVLQLPAEHHAFAIFALGYPAESKPQQDRYDVSRIHYDMAYRNKRIEVKATSYVHPWNKEISPIRTFSIAPTNNSYWENQDAERKLSRQSEVYVFCLNTNKDIGKRNALTVDDWVFYVVPTFVVDGYCKETPAQKKISLNVVKRLAKEEVSYDRLREAVDEAIVLSDSYYMDK